MRVKDLIERLQRDYKPEDRLLIVYWDKEFAATALEDELAGEIYPAEAWEDTIRRAEKAEYWQACGTEELIDQASQALKDYKEASK